jgi:hypothetical protein
MIVFEPWYDLRLRGMARILCRMPNDRVSIQIRYDRRAKVIPTQRTQNAAFVLFYPIVQDSRLGLLVHVYKIQGEKE